MLNNEQDIIMIYYMKWEKIENIVKVVDVGMIKN